MSDQTDTSLLGSFIGINFAQMDIAATVEWVLSAMQGERFQYVVTPNVDHVVKLHSESGQPWHPAFDAAVQAADLRINDSRILQQLARFSGIDLPVVPGSDLTSTLVATGVPAGSIVTLIGGSTDDADWLRRHLHSAKIVQFQPPMGVLHNAAAQQEIVDFIEAERPALTLFAIGAPQSEIVAHQVQQRASAPGVGLCIGASVEFLSGAKRRAPAAMQRVGLEWAFRLLSEPRRMWRRYLVEGPKIFLIWRRWSARRRSQ